MPRSRALVAGLLAAALTAGPAAAAPVSADLMTVSGRFEAPKAVEGPLKGRILVTAASLAPANADLLGDGAGKIEPSLKGAVEASLRNFGYLAAADHADPIRLTVQVDPYEVTPDPEGVFVVARLHLTATGGGADCVPTTAEARYHALAPMKALNKQKAAAWMQVIGLAAVGLMPMPGVFQEMGTASASDRAANDRRGRTESQSVSPDGSPKGILRYAAINATQIASADLIRQLGKGACPTRAQVADVTPPPAPPAN